MGSLRIGPFAQVNLRDARRRPVARSYRIRISGRRRDQSTAGRRTVVFGVDVTLDSYTLAGSDVTIPLLGVGTWAWGDRATWGMGGYDADLTRVSIQEAWGASLDAGVTLFDTAEVYGGGESERIIGAMLAGDPSRAASAVIASKFLPYPWKLRVRGALPKSLRASLGRLGLPTVDLYQIHGPISLRSHAALADALADAHEMGLVKAVGVSNYPRGDPGHGRSLAQRGMRLATNQIEFSLLRRSPETSGLLDDVQGIGRRADRVLAARPGPAHRQVLGAATSARREGTSAVTRWQWSKRSSPSSGESARSTEGRRRVRSALNWVIAKGAVPIPGAKNRHQAEDNAGALGWSIDDEDLARLDRVALPGVRSPRGRIWQHG